MIRKISMAFCLIVTVLFIWVWHHQSQFNDHSRKGFFHLRNGELDQAVEAYAKAIRNKERTIFFAQAPSAYNNLGQAYLRKEEYAPAIAAFQKTLEMSPDAVGAYINLATAYLKQDLPDSAIELCEAAIQISPDVAHLHYNLACAYALKKEDQKSIDSLQRAVELDGRMRVLAREEEAFDRLRSHPIFSAVLE